MVRPLLLALALLVAATTPGWAHHPNGVGQGDPAGSETWEPEASHPDRLEPARDETPGPGLPVAWIVLAVAAAGASASHRRAVAGALTGLLLTFAVETAIHSVHHLGRGSEMERCPLAGAAVNLSATLDEPVTVAAPRAPTIVAVSVAPPPASLRGVAPVPGRSPPLSA
jgi:hypothetical protein